MLTRIPLAALGQRAQQPLPARRGRQARLAAGAAVRSRRQHRADPKVEREAAKLEERAAAASLPRAARSAPSTNDGPGASTSGRASLAGIERRIRVRTETLARQFDRVLSVLRELGYVEEWSVTEKGRSLSRIYGEGDILVAEALSRGIFDDLEPRRGGRPALVGGLRGTRARAPVGRHADAGDRRRRYELLQRTWRRIRRTEDDHQVQLCRELEAGFATPDLPLGERAPARGRARRDRHGSRRLRAQLQAAPRPAAAGRGGRTARGRGVVRPGSRRRCCAASSPTRGSELRCGRDDEPLR